MNELVIIATLIILILLTVIILDTHRFVVARDFINTSKVKGSIKIAFLSDLHDKHFGENNEKLLAAVRKEKPDIVLIGGDMITAKLGEDITETMAFLKELAKDNTVYYGIGNHEYRVSLYPENYGSLYDDFLAGIQEAGIRILRNEVIEDKDKNIRIYGSEIDRRFYKRFKQHPMEPDYMKEILGEADGEACFRRTVFVGLPQHCRRREGQVPRRRQPDGPPGRESGVLVQGRRRRQAQRQAHAAGRGRRDPRDRGGVSRKGRPAGSLRADRPERTQTRRRLP